MGMLEQSAMSGDFWYAKIVLERGWEPSKSAIVLKSEYSNIRGEVYLNLLSYYYGFNAYVTDYNGCNIVGIRKNFENDKSVIYLKLQKPTGSYNGSIYYYGGYDATITVSATDLLGNGLTYFTLEAGKTYGVMANKLATARTLWGQSFDGSGNVSGFMKNVSGFIYGGDIGEDWSDGVNTHPWYGIDYRHCIDSSDAGKAYTSISSYFGLYFKVGGVGGGNFIFDGGNVGIGTSNPTEKLDVNCTIHASGATTLSSTLYVGNNATIAGTLGVTGTTTLKSGLTLEANAYISGEVFFSAADAFRLNYGSYGVIHRNDGGSYWILLTDKNNQDGGFNNLRPFHIDFSTGTVHMDNNAIIDNLAFTQCNISMGGRVNATWGYDLNTSDYYGLYFKSKNSSSTGILFNDDGSVGIGTFAP
jgi:hypothetical protein